MEDSEPIGRSETDLESEIEALREDIVKGGPVVLNHRLFLDREEIQDRFEQILQMIPREARRAKRICREEQSIIQDARDEARRLIDEARAEAETILVSAREEADRLVDSSTIRQRALEQAEQILARADANAREVRESSYAYARDVIGNVIQSLDRLTQTVQRDRAQLEAHPPNEEPSEPEAD